MVNITQGHDFGVLFNEATQQLVLQYPSHADFGNSMQVLSEPLGPGDAAPVWNAPTEITTLKACTGFNVGPGTYVPFLDVMCRPFVVICSRLLLSAFSRGRWRRAAAAARAASWPAALLRPRQHRQEQPAPAGDRRLALGRQRLDLEADDE